VLQLKSAWRDGTTRIRMSPLKFMQRLAGDIVADSQMRRLNFLFADCHCHCGPRPPSATYSHPVRPSPSVPWLWRRSLPAACRRRPAAGRSRRGAGRRAAPGGRSSRRARSRRGCGSACLVG
jgi:prepilin-type processing-associated H-X9-DG protein